MANINWTVGLQLDAKDLQAQLSTIQSDIQNSVNNTFRKNNVISKDLQDAGIQAKNLQNALKIATTDKGLSLPALTLSLAKANSSVDKMLIGLSKGGAAFAGSFNVALESLAVADRRVHTISARLTEMLRVMKQSAKYTAAQATFRFIMTQLRQAKQWTEDLNKQLTQISIVSGKTGAQLDQVYSTIINGSKQLKVAAKDYAEAAQIFYQQGLDTAEVEKRTRITIQAAKAAGQSVDSMSNQLTAIWNTYKMAGDELERSAAVAAKLGAETAIEFKDIAEAMQISASAAATMGVSYDSLASIIATVGETTRQSASIIGTAYKTIFSRFEQLKSAGTDGEITLNTVSQNLANMGINVLDQAGNLRELDDVITEVGQNWTEYSKKQQIAIAEAVGGTRQYAQFLALMNNFDKYQQNLISARSEDGSTLAKQYAAYQGGLEASKVKMRESWSKAGANIFSEDNLKAAYTLLEKIGNVVEKITLAAGNWKNMLVTIGSYLGAKMVPNLLAMLKAQQSLHDTKIIEKIGFNDTRAQAYSQSLTQQNQSARADYISKLPNNALSRSSYVNRTQLNAFDIDQSKIDMYGKIRNINVELNKLKKTGTAEEQAQAAALQEQLTALHQIYNAEQDKIKNAGIEAAAKGHKVAAAFSLQNDQERDASVSSSLRTMVNQTPVGTNETFANFREEIDNIAQAGLTSDEVLDSLRSTLDSYSGTLKNLTPEQRKFVGSLQAQVKEMENMDESRAKVQTAAREEAAAEESVTETLETQKVVRMGLTAETIAGMAQMGMAITGMISQMSALMDAIDSGNANVLTVIGTIGTLLPLLMILNKAITIMFPAALAKLKTSYKIFGIEIQTTTATMTMGISLLITAVIALITWIGKKLSKYSKRFETAAEDAQELANHTQELTNSLEEQSDALDNNIAKWQEANRTGENIAETYKAMTASAQELSNTLTQLGIDQTALNAAFATGIATGDFTKYQQEFAKAQTAAKQKTMENQAAAATAIGTKYGAKNKTVGLTLQSTQGINSVYSGVANKSIGNTADLLSSYNDLYKLQQQLTAEMQAMEKPSTSIINDIDAISAKLEEMSEDYNNATEDIQNVTSSFVELANGSVTQDAAALKGASLQDQVNYLGQAYTQLHDILGDNATPEQYEAAIASIAGANSSLANAYSTMLKAQKLAQQVAGDAASTEEIEEKYQEIMDTFNTMSAEDRKLLLQVDLDYVKTPEEIQKILAGQKEIQAELHLDVKTDGELKDQIKGYNDLESAFSNALSDNDSQGYVSDDNAYALIEAGYSKYLTEVAGKFYITTEAANAYNNALKQEHEATKQLLENSRNFLVEMPQLAAQLKTFEVTMGDQNIFGQMTEDIITLCNDSSNNSIAGLTKYLDDLNTKLAAIDLSTLSGDDLQQASSGIGAIVEAIGMFQEKLDNNLAAGTISMTDYLKGMQKTFTTARAGAQKELDSINETLKDDTLSEDAITALELRAQKLQDTLTDFDEKATKFNGVQTWASTVEANIEELDKYFDQDWQLQPKVDPSGIIAGNKAVMDSVRDAWNMLDEETKKGLQVSSTNFAQMTYADAETVMGAARTEAESSINSVGTAVGAMLQAVGDAATKLDLTVSVTPDPSSTLKIDLAKLFFKGEVKPTGSIKFNINASGESLQNLGNVASEAAEYFNSQFSVDFGKNSFMPGKTGISTIGPNGKGSVKDDPDLVRYENLEKQIDVVNHLLEKTEKAIDKTFGAKKAKLLDEYNKRLAYQSKLQQELLAEANAYYETDKANLLMDVNNAAKAQFITVDGVETLANSEDIRNYWETFKANNKDEYQVAYAEKQLKYLDKYLETVEKKNEVFMTLLDNLDKYTTNLIESMSAKLELKIEIDERDLKLAENLLKGLASEGKKTTKALDLLNKKINTTIEESTDQLAITNDLIAMMTNPDEAGFVEKFGQEAWDYYQDTGMYSDTILTALNEDADALLDYQSNLIDYNNEMASALLDAFHAYLDDFDVIAKRIDSNLKTMDAWKSIFQTLGMDKTDSKTYLGFFDAELDAQSAKLAEKQAELEVAKKAAAEAQSNLESFDGDKNSSYYAKLKEAADETSQSVADLGNEVLELANEQLVTLQEAISAVADAAANDFARSMGYYDWEAMKTGYDQAKELSERYLTDTNRDYGLDTLNRSMNQYLAEADVTGARLKEYAAFAEKINKLKKEDKDITQEELDILNAEFELMKAQDAYENAKNQKNSMRLVRDASGNYSYQYTANDNAISNAEQQLADVQNKLYNLRKEYADKSSELYWQTLQEYRDWQATFREDLYTTDAEYKASWDETQRYYEEKLIFYKDTVVEQYGQIDDKFEDSALGVISGCADMEEAHNILKGVVVSTADQMKDAWTKWADHFDEANTAVKGSYETLQDAATAAQTTVVDSSDNMKTAITSLKTTAITNLDAIGTKVDSWAANFTAKCQSVIDKITETTNKINELARAENAKSTQGTAPTVTTSTGSTTGGTTSVPSGGNTGQAPKAPQTPQTPATPKQVTVTWNGAGGKFSGGKTSITSTYEAGHVITAPPEYPTQEGYTFKTWSPELGRRGYTVNSDTTITAVWNKIKYIIWNETAQRGISDNGNKLDYATSRSGCKVFNSKEEAQAYYDNMGLVKRVDAKFWDGSFQVEQLETGGYTGEFDGGALAVLHQKELVLNAQDTENIMNAVSVMRNLVQDQLGRQVLALADNAHGNSQGNNAMTIDQKVQIDATFPNVSVASEIEDAFSNLINQAAQYNLK